jgi:hypothetical protein
MTLFAHARRVLFFVGLLALCGAQSVCGTTAIHPLVKDLSPVCSNFIWRTQQGQLTERQIWNLRTTVDAYKKQGVRSPAWDKQAIEALEAYSLTRGLGMSEGVHQLEAMVATNCDGAVFLKQSRDMLLRSLAMRFAERRPGPDPSSFSAGSISGAAQDLNATGYPAVRKLFAWLHAIEAGAKDRELRDPDGMREAVTKLLPALFEDKEMPAEDIFSACLRWLELCKAVGRNQYDAWKEIDPLVQTRLKNTQYPLALSGQAHLHWAWEARGTDWASNIRPEAWRLMEDRLKLARQDLEKAWLMNTNDHQAATIMLRVVLLESAKFEEMEKWFQRAMKDTNNLIACHMKLNFLLPQWGGTTLQLKTFAHECLTNSTWMPGTAEIVPAAYQYFDRTEQAWPEIRAAFEKLLRHYPWDYKYKRELMRWGRMTGRESEAEKFLSR